MPEFGTIAMAVLAIAIVGIIAVTAKSRLNSNNTTMNVSGNTTMSGSVYKLATVGIIAIIIFGAYMAISGYNSDIYPLDRIRGNLDGVIASSDPLVIHDHLVAIQSDLDLVVSSLPDTVNDSGDVVAKNPVWIFGTESTNFLRIQNNINTMITSVDELSTISKDNPAYHTGMIDITERAALLKINIMDATPSMYVSPANIISSAIWVAAIVGIFTLLKKKKEQLKKVDLPNNVPLETS